MHSVEKTTITVGFRHVTVPAVKINNIRALKINRNVLKQLRRYRHSAGNLKNFGALLAKLIDHIENDKELDMPLKSEFFEISYRAHTHYLEIWNVATPGVSFCEPDPDPSPPGLSLTFILFDKSSSYFESDEFKNILFYDLGLRTFENDYQLLLKEHNPYFKVDTVHHYEKNSKGWMLRNIYRVNTSSSLEIIMYMKSRRWKISSSLKRKYSPVKNIYPTFIVTNIQTYKVTLMTNIRGNNDGLNGRNETYKIGSRKAVPRRTAVKEVKRGDHPGAHVVTRNNREYVRDNPDSSKKDNVNQ